MQRLKATFPLKPEQGEFIKFKMLNWAKPFSIFLFLDSNQYKLPYKQFEYLIAVNALHVIIGNSSDSLNDIDHYQKLHKDWLFGHIAYDYKNKLEVKLTSGHTKNHNWDDLFFFCPETVCYLEKGSQFLTIETVLQNPDVIFNQIMESQIEPEPQFESINFQSKISNQNYLKTIESLRKHIADGDCYEINFCAERFAQNVDLNPLAAFIKLNQVSPAPYAAFYRNNQSYLMCASPERYLCKKENVIRSMPIKGTIRRGNSEVEDWGKKQLLLHSEKNKAENVMIVDLVRNDLARSCTLGSIKVEELFGLYTFPQVHHLISTVSGQLSPQKTAVDAIRYSFPMGSMTGAPKVKVMEIIEEYEHSKRELFSGSVGYFSPEGNFDFNVVIRSLFYNAANQYLSYQTGGAITYDSNAEEEFEEMRLKAWALERVFSD